MLPPSIPSTAAPPRQTQCNHPTSSSGSQPMHGLHSSAIKFGQCEYTLPILSSATTYIIPDTSSLLFIMHWAHLPFIYLLAMALNPLSGASESPLPPEQHAMPNQVSLTFSIAISGAHTPLVHSRMRAMRPSRHFLSETPYVRPWVNTGPCMPPGAHRHISPEWMGS